MEIMTKNSKLLRHPSVRKIIDEFHVICKCGKKIKLDCKFVPDFLERHSKSSACKFTNDNITQITNFFDKKTSNCRRKLCHGLSNERTKIYLRCVAGITSYEGAPPVEDIAKKSFPKKIRKNFSWSKLNEVEKIKLLDELKN